MDTVKGGVSNDYYILLAVILHQGSESFGHYTCVMREIVDAVQAHSNGQYDAGTWYSCSDTHKTKVKYATLARWMISAGDPTPYQLIYYKVHSITPPNSIVIPSMPAI